MLHPTAKPPTKNEIIELYHDRQLDITEQADVYYL